ncbi:MAG: CinA family protein [Candidatus Omnitrophota bacterium]|nr:MAG: CinA family protein [Candidatus Omnitrophota bacterium]
MKRLESLIRILRAKKTTVSVAESCSGGYLAYLLTKVPGSSKVFKGGLIVYSLDAKKKFFKISPWLLKKTKGVSGKIAFLLAQKVRNLFRTDIGVSIVGFAGPQAQKGIKIGTVFMCVADKRGLEVKKMIIKGGRDQVRKKASRFAVELLSKRLQINHTLLKK